MDNALESMEESLDNLGLEDIDWSLVLFILISICWDVEDITWLLWWFKGEGNSVFTNSLMDATIQDGSMREKSNKPCLFFAFISLTNFSFFKKNHQFIT